MKSIDTSAPRACGRADTTKASMLNANRNFFIMIKMLRGVRLQCLAIYSSCHSKTASTSRVWVGRNRPPRRSLAGRAVVPRSKTFELIQIQKCDFLKIGLNGFEFSTLFIDLRRDDVCHRN